AIARAQAGTIGLTQPRLTSRPILMTSFLSTEGDDIRRLRLTICPADLDVSADPAWLGQGDDQPNHSHSIDHVALHKRMAGLAMFRSLSSEPAPRPSLSSLRAPSPLAGTTTTSAAA